jgi:uncharacterized protein YabN with tetrapyrrole methylase and pyrophosphatase domain
MTEIRNRSKITEILKDAIRSIIITLLSVGQYLQINRRDASAIWFEKLFVLFCFLDQQIGLEKEAEVAKSALEDLGALTN